MKNIVLNSNDPLNHNNTPTNIHIIQTFETNIKAKNKCENQLYDPTNCLYNIFQTMSHPNNHRDHNKDQIDSCSINFHLENNDRDDNNDNSDENQGTEESESATITIEKIEELISNKKFIIPDKNYHNIHYNINWNVCHPFDMDKFNKMKLNEIENRFCEELVDFFKEFYNFIIENFPKDENSFDFNFDQIIFDIDNFERLVIINFFNLIDSDNGRHLDYCDTDHMNLMTDKYSKITIPSLIGLSSSNKNFTYKAFINCAYRIKNYKSNTFSEKFNHIKCLNNQRSNYYQSEKDRNYITETCDKTKDLLLCIKFHHIDRTFTRPYYG
jgi:hypothetical protein